MKWPTSHPPAPPPTTEAELAAHAKRTEAKRAKIEALERAEMELPGIEDCTVDLYDLSGTGSFFCEWPREADFDPFMGIGATPALAHAALLEKLLAALEEKRLRDEDDARLNDAMMRAKD